MSNYLAFATVTATLREIIEQAVLEVVPGVQVRVGPPGTVPAGDGPEVGVYLQRVSPRNHSLPPDPQRRPLDRPAIAVDLHYLFTFWSWDHLAAELLLARVLAKFHATPVLPADELRKVVRADGPFPFLKDSDLADAGPIRLIQEVLSQEEVGLLWSALAPARHRPSLHYVVSPILLDAG